VLSVCPGVALARAFSRLIPAFSQRRAMAQALY
jgi:hypothetical protein